MSHHSVLLFNTHLREALCARRVCTDRVLWLQETEQKQDPGSTTVAMGGREDGTCLWEARWGWWALEGMRPAGDGTLGPCMGRGEAVQLACRKASHQPGRGWGARGSQEGLGIGAFGGLLRPSKWAR